MPIVTTINGNAEDLRAAARWIGSLAASMWAHGVERVDAVRKESEPAWQDEAAERFRRRLTRGSAAVEELCSTSAQLREAIATYADSLIVARDHMAAARSLALNAGLMMTDHEIFDPGPAIVETPRGTIDHTIGGSYERMVAGYEQARIEGAIAESVLYSAWAYVRATGRDLIDREKASLTAGAFITGWTHDLTARSTAALKGTADAYRQAAATARSSYNRILSLPTVDERLYKEMALMQKAMGDAAEYEQRVAKAIRFGRTVKLTGWAVVLAGVGYDIYRGKPVTKAVFVGALGVGGSLAAEGIVSYGFRALAFRLAGIGAGAILATSAAPEAVVVGSGIVAGAALSVAADRAYDELFPTQERQIREGEVVIVDEPRVPSAESDDAAT